MTSEFVPATEDPFPAKRAARPRSMGSASLRFIPTRLVCAHHECKPLKVSRVALPAICDSRVSARAQLARLQLEAASLDSPRDQDLTLASGSGKNLKLWSTRSA